MSFKMVVSALAATLALAGAGSAAAAIYDFTFSGSGFSGSGTLTTDDGSGQANPYPCAGCTTNTGYLVTAITGQLNGDAIDGLLLLDDFAGNDNLIYPVGPGFYLDYGDLGFSVGGVKYNLFEGSHPSGSRPAGAPGYFLINHAANIYENPVDFSLTVGVPEPAAWALMILGFGGVGGMLRRDRRRMASPTT